MLVKSAAKASERKTIRDRDERQIDRDGERRESGRAGGREMFHSGATESHVF